MRKKLPDTFTILIVSHRVPRGEGVWETVRVGYLVELGLVSSARNDRLILSGFAHDIRFYAVHGGSHKAMTEEEVAKLRADNADVTEITWRTSQLFGEENGKAANS